ncbi:MAG: aromatic ring-hydroxylating dioxygenase subunit alpha [Woeseiaceae bacterium]|nr:aromatic ring-hydroxylating dioxygenase subunit alpha [Woeseiaceae bacterium]
MPRTLPELRPALPAAWYYDPTQYRRELDAIWYRDWICVGRAESLAGNGDYFTASIGDQNVIVARVADGALRAWHNTCRHRGSLLCETERGRFRNGRIVCPYHTWTYDLDGALVATPGRLETPDFDPGKLSLLGVHVDTWQGFVFINLADEPVSDLDTFLGAEKDYLANWPLESMHSVHREIIPVECNWKIFWENYSECYHCPRVHPELGRIMPVYRQAVFDEADLPGWQPRFPGDRGFGRVAPGVKTWSVDGSSSLPLLDGPTDEERAVGVAFTSITGSMYVHGHPDYARSVRIVPRGPERLELVVDWLLPTALGDVDREIIDEITGLALLVLRQDAKACELNQRGLRSRDFEHGVLVPQEYVLWEFHEWLRGRLEKALS